LAVLALKKAQGIPWLPSAEIARSLRDEHGITVHWRTVEAELRGAKALVARRRRSNRYEFAIMAPGEQALLAPKGDALVIDPAKALQGTLSLHAILAGLKGTVRICDPYVDYSTMQHLDSCTGAAAVHLLTDNISDSGRLRALVAAGATQTPRIEVRKVVSHRLHDRYIIDDGSMHILGTSLNGFGKKQCFVVQLGQDIRNTMLTFFKSAWASAKPWP
jgi:hypothetical protein